MAVSVTVSVTDSVTKKIKQLDLIFKSFLIILFILFILIDLISYDLSIIILCFFNITVCISSVSPDFNLSRFNNILSINIVILLDNL